MARTAYLISLLFSLLQCFAFVAGDNPLDIGAIRSCVRYQSTTCDIDYFIPESVANLTAIKDAFIEGILMQNEQNNEDCLLGLRKILCAEEYPQCIKEEDKVSVILPENCTQLLSTCSELIQENYCDFAPANLSLAKCETIGNQATEYNYDFKHCDRVETWTSDYVTEWMFSYLKKIDEEVENVLQTLIFNEECQLKYIEFKCSSLGRCWDNGSRTELTTNRTDCLFIRDVCLSSSQKQFLEPELQCESWPDAIQLATIPTMITSSPENNTNNTQTSPSPFPPSPTTTLSVSLPSNTPTVPSSATIHHISLLLVLVVSLFLLSSL